MLAISLALGASIGYGLTDFLGGLAARKIPVLLLGAISQPLGLVFLLFMLPLSDGVFSQQALVWGAISGVGGAIAYVMLFQSLAIGPMSVASPISALIAVVIPVLAGIAFGERLPWAAWVGIFLGAAAVLMVSQVHSDAPHPVSLRVVLLATGAGVFISIFLVALERSPDDSGLWPLIVVRIVTTILMVTFAFGTGSVSRPPRDAVLLGSASTILDVLATLLFLLATRDGLLSVVAVITALYPAATVLMAKVVLGEHLQAIQRWGLGLAAVSVSLLAVAV
ncbi:MAG TPA: DMT family transporter [Actinomycetes bacterium]|nr:DMT family transporter [Actinomycetes bacterium]